MPQEMQAPAVPLHARTCEVSCRPPPKGFMHGKGRERDLSVERPEPSCQRAWAMIVKKPSAGDKILLLKPQYIEQILRGAKNMEIRSAPYRAGIYYIGTGGQIFGQVRTAHAVPIHNMTEFIRIRHKHHMVCSTLPYKKTYGLPIVACAPVTARFRHPRGAITIVRFREL